MLQISSNIDEEIIKLREYKELTEACNELDLDKLFISIDRAAELLHCSTNMLKASIKKDKEFPVQKYGKTSVISVIALLNYTMRRHVNGEF